MMTGPSMLDQSLRALETHGAVQLAGARSRLVTRWVRRRRAMSRAFLIAGGVGILLVAAGLLLVESGAGAVLMVVGGFLGAFGLLTGAMLAFTLRRERDRLSAETEPVVIDERGITCRGVGPIPWSDVAAPAQRHVSAMVEIGGPGAAMRLTPEGIAHVNGLTVDQQVRIGPRPNFGIRIRYFLLPGVAGLSEDETLHLFAAAHRRFAR